MHCYRITKYNPQYRNELGGYTKSEWTSYSDIEKVFGEKKFTLEEYLKTESAYVNTIVSFMECLGLDFLTVSELEKYNPPKENTHYTSYLVDAYAAIKNGEIITKETAALIARLALRENLWCKLESKEMYIHFGYDYYMYIGSTNSCEKIMEKIKESGLFVEPYKSPYLNNFLLK